MGAYGWTIDAWRQAYLAGDAGAEDLLRWLAGFSLEDPSFIHLATEAEVRAQLDALSRRMAAGAGGSFPLCGVPFAVKDNIDVAGWPTTAACPAFSRVAERDAEVVARLREAGAIVVGKTNLDQFATGLVGTRSPYGVVPSCFDADYIGGGSSSGSAAVVARGFLPFALGTDTAGSGRVPAAFQNIVGYKPTRGRWSTRGVVPACRTLDCVSVFALTVHDAAKVAEVLSDYDAQDPYARRPPASSSAPDEGSEGFVAPRIGIPEPLDFAGDALAEAAFRASVERLSQLDYRFEPVDFSPFRELAELLYGGPWVVERYLVACETLQAQPEALDPLVRGILEASANDSARAAFLAEYRRASLARAVDRQLAPLCALLVPTTPTTYRIEQVAAEPLATNARLGTYTNFTNLADLCAIALPGCFRTDGLPAGLTLLAPAFREDRLVRLAAQVQAHLGLPLGATGVPCAEACSPPPALTTDTNPEMDRSRATIAVLGAHLRGMPLNHQLTDLGAHFLREGRTAPRYRLYALAGTAPQKPGLSRVEQGGAAIALELWSMPLSALGPFLCGIPSPLGLGKVELEDGRWVVGFICEPSGVEAAEDITHHGGFRAYLRAMQAEP